MTAKTTNTRPDRKKNDRRRDNRREPSEYEDVTLSVDRVTRVVKGGRRMRFRAIVVLGNRKGKVGLGTGKAGEVQVAVQKAQRDAKRAMIIIPMKGNSIPHEVNVKHKAARLRLMPASKGTGNITGGPLRIVLDLAGIKDVLAKRFGTGNKLVNAQAAMKALSMLRGSRIAKITDKAPHAAGGAVAPSSVAAKSAAELGIHIPEGPNLPIKEVTATQKDIKEMGEGPKG
ncbi:MAG: 30S ribosomal protein S5 [Candidatus Peribacteraceae bacterium]|nr:30S ribosomal protein S5 [Candidatus Peribacteraceae bacterium]MBP9850705.1 30S ribosomal protein S5 [Candidatus Peribacteraceae bacterium]